MYVDSWWCNGDEYFKALENFVKYFKTVLWSNCLLWWAGNISLSMFFHKYFTQKQRWRSDDVICIVKTFFIFLSKLTLFLLAFSLLPQKCSYFMIFSRFNVKLIFSCNNSKVTTKWRMTTKTIKNVEAFRWNRSGPFTYLWSYESLMKALCAFVSMRLIDSLYHTPSCSWWWSLMKKFVSKFCCWKVCLMQQHVNCEWVHRSDERMGKCNMTLWHQRVFKKCSGLFCSRHHSLCNGVLVSRKFKTTKFWCIFLKYWKVTCNFQIF